MRKFSQITPDEDASLLLSWYRGDLSAFETLIWKYQKRIFNLALLLTNTQKTAGEVAEHAFIAAYQNIGSLKSTGRFSSWLAALALKECRELSEYRHEEPESAPEADQKFNDENSSAAALHKKIVFCIRELPGELRELILLRYVRGYSLERVEEILQISGEMVLSRLFAAQETLACWLKSDSENPAELASMQAVSAIHPEIRKHFSAYLDSSAEDKEKELIKTHLKSCGICREALAELEAMTAEIKSIPDVEPPQWLAASIMKKIKTVPAKPRKVMVPAKQNMKIAGAALFIAVIGVALYLMQSKPEPERQLSRSVKAAVPAPAVEQNAAPAGTGGTALPKTVFRGAPTTTDALVPVEKPARPVSVPLPNLLPSQQPLPADSPLKPGQPVAGGKSEPIQRIEKPAVLQPGLQEWGDQPPQERILPKKAPQPKARGGEVAVVLSSPDPVAAAHEIESAVVSIGGRINGRAYSGGADILYTRVDVERFFELMGQLRKIGTVQELPRLPEGAQGPIDLVIRW